MNRLQRLPLLLVMTVLLLGAAAPAFAASHAEAEDPSEPVTTDTVAEAVPISEGEVPAVVVPELEPEEIEQPWTARYLIPFLVVSAIVVLIAVVVIYNRSIRKRYVVVA